MPDEVQDASMVSSPTTDAPAPSAEQAPVQEQVSQEGTAPTTLPDPAQTFHMPPAERWEELRQQKAAAEQRAQHAEQLAQLALQRLQGVVQPATQQDYWSGKVDHPDAVTAQFYQQQKAMVDPIIQEVRSMRDAVDAGRKELAEVKIENFRLRNPNITPNSEDEKAIAGLVSQGFPLDAARKLTLYDRQEQELQALKAKHSSVGQKVAANQTGPTQGMPATAGLPGRPGDWRDSVRQAARKGGTLADIVNAAGASRTP